jgi:hypothetical protein
MRRAVIVIAGLLACAFPTGVGAHATVRMLSLPAGATIDPFGPRALIAVAQNGTIAATVTLNGWMNRVAVWDTAGQPRLVTNGATSVSAFDQNEGLMTNGVRPMRIDGSDSSPIDLSTCEAFPQSSAGMTVAGMLSNGSLIATVLSPPVVNLDDTSGQTAPVVVHLRSSQCLNIGNGVATATAGLYTAGFIAYINNVPAPSNVVSSKERYVAMRWHERTREPLGSGIALAINDAGVAAGSDEPTGSAAREDAPAHAMLWRSPNDAVALAPNSPLSVAYAVDSRGRATGMLEDDRHHHIAFLWTNGSLQRLDDIVNAPGWRFECGYAFTADGTIVGIGTYRGTPAVFEISGI